MDYLELYRDRRDSGSRPQMRGMVSYLRKNASADAGPSQWVSRNPNASRMKCSMDGNYSGLFGALAKFVDFVKKFESVAHKPTRPLPGYSSGPTQTPWRSQKVDTR